MIIDLSLFPSKEDWGTGDEALDNKLSIALKKSAFQPSFDSISDFYFFSISLKPRTINPTFIVNIELVTKALFNYLDPSDCIDHTIKKMKGQYFSKEKISFEFVDLDFILKELEINKKYRYKNQIDFSFNLQDPAERNPFVRSELKRSKIDMNTKVIFKEFKSYLNEELKSELYTEPFFQLLRGGKRVLVIKDFAEIWYHQEQIFSIKT